MRDKILKILHDTIGKGDYRLDVPKEKQHGDFSTNAAMILAKEQKTSPRKIAEEFKHKLEKADHEGIIEKIEIAGPGFINFYIKNSIVQNVLKEIIEKGDDFGKSYSGKGKKVLIEFVSANPTGPLHIGHGRWAAIGDSVANILKAVGYSVDKEFYINNIGKQVDMLVLSVLAAMEGKATPEGGYGGAYIKEIAKEAGKYGHHGIKEEVLNTILNEQKKALKDLHVEFDNWFEESKLHDSGAVKNAIENLKEHDSTYEKDGAVWFKSTEFGDDKDRVLVRENGDTTYFAADVAYHAEKFKRGYDLMINVWGTDHHGYVKRLQSAMDALKLHSEKLEILLGQLVTLYRGDEPVRMSKRTGEMITLQEVIDETGADATRFFLLLTGADTHLDFDIELAKKQSMDNPVYYVQYAYARLCNIQKNSGMSGEDLSKADHSLLKEDSEIELIKKLASLPAEVIDAAEAMQPHHIVRYSRDLASLFHSYYHKQRVICEDKELMKARLALIESTRIVLSNVLKLLGISAPERM